jgi:hypothetical protein
MRKIRSFVYLLLGLGPGASTLGACTAALDFDAVSSQAHMPDSGSAPDCSAQGQFSRADDVVFLADCDLKDGSRRSEMDYYSKFACAQSGELPEAIAITTADQDGTTSWKGNTTTGLFPDENEFVATIDAQDAQVYGIQGTGHNKQKPFLCYRDTWRVLYETDEMICRSRYYCRPASRPMT